MRTISQLPVVQDESVQFPFGTIQNETDTQDGTPVVREIYGDLLTNIYKLLQIVGVTPTGTEDSDATQYQIIEALQRLANNHSDVEQILSLAGSVFSAPLNFELLPDKFVFTARAGDAYISGNTYTFKGNTAVSYPFSSPTGFASSDELIVVVDHSGVRAYSITAIFTAAPEIFPAMGIPVAFNNTSKLYYDEFGKLFSDTPSVTYLENTIRFDSGEPTLIVNDIFIMQGYVLCFCFIPDAVKYVFYQFPFSDFSESTAVELSGVVFDDGSDFMPYIYTDGTSLYVTNDCNNSALDYIFNRLSYNPNTAIIAFISSFSIDNTFVKTSNSAVKNNILYTYIAGVYASYTLPAGVKSNLGTFPGVNGNLFNFNGNVYFSTGEVAKKWL